MLTVRLLGDFEVRHAGQRVDIPSRVAQALLAHLLLPPGKAHRRERLAGLLWPDAPEVNALRNLRQALWVLNRALGAASSRLVAADRVNIWLDVRGLAWLDVEVLQAAMPDDASLEALQDQARVYAGELLPGFYDDWVVVERERLEGHFERLMRRLLARLEAEQRWAEVLEWGQRWIGLGHVPEEAYRAVMRAHAALGEASSAFLTYQRCREALREHLGLEPSDQTRALYSQIVQAAGMEAPPPEAGDWAPTVDTAPAPAAETSGSPYKGLHYFTEDDARLYFGRERLVELLLDYMRHEPFMVVVGASGSGKSSLVRAGLVPPLRGQVPWPPNLPPIADSTHWSVHIFTPGRSPLQSLAASLLGEADPIGTAALATELRESRAALHGRAAGEPARLLVVDQFEEVFTLCRDEAERRAFIHNLMYAARPERGERLRMVLTLRADFYAHCANYAELRLALEAHQYFIGPMTAGELRRAIEAPAQRAGLTFQPGLVDLILRDVGDEPGALPLLSHALLETWRRRRQGQLVLAGYAEAGGVHGAIARTAEQVYQGLPPDQQALARGIFLRLTEPGEGTEATRRRAALAELMDEAGRERPVEAVLQVLAEARLITIGQDMVEVAHEALIRAWPTLQQWLAEDREGLRLHRRLTEAAQAWDALDRDPAELYRGARLAQAREWAQAHTEALNALEHEFLAASWAQAEQEAAEREAQSRREVDTARQLAEAEKVRARLAAEAARRQAVATQGLWGTLLVAIGLLALAIGFAWRAQANLARSEAQRLAAQADALVQAGGDAQLIALLAIQSLNRQYSPAGDAVLNKALGLNYPTLSLQGHTNSLRDVAYSPDSQYIATAANDSTARLWRTDTGAEVQRFVGHSGPVTSVAFMPDGKYVVTGGEDGRARIWEAATGAPVAQLVGHGSLIQSVVVSADGQWVATAGGDDTVRRWSTATGAQVGDSLLVASESVAISPDGKWLLTGGKDGLAVIWDWQSGAMLRELVGHTGRIIEVAFSPDGTLALTGSVDKTARLWDTATGEPLMVLKGHTAGVFAVSFSPDGGRVVTAGEDRNARLWETATGRELGRFYGHSATVTEVAFAPDGRHFATAGGDGVALVWDTQPEGPVHMVASHPAQIWNVAFSPDGRYLATASVDKTARLWDVQTGEQAQIFLGHKGEIWGLAFSPNGRWLLTGSFDKTARLWETATGVELRQLTPPAEQVVNGVAFAPDGRLMVTADEGGVVNLWDTETGAWQRNLMGHSSGLNLTAVSPDGALIATTSNDATAVLWSAQTGERLHVLAGHTAFVTSVAFSPDGRRVATGAGDSVVNIWDTATGALVRSLTGHSEIVWSVAYGPAGRYLATASADGTARLWDTTTWQEVRRFSGHTAGVQAVAIAPDGQLIATGSDDGTARLWEIDIEATVRVLCGRLLRDLTAQERAQYGVRGSGATCED